MRNRKYATIPKSFVGWFKIHFTEPDVIDIGMEYDRFISVSENKEEFIKKFSRYYVENPKEYKEIMKAQKEQNKKEAVKQLFQQRKSYLEESMGVELNFVK